MGFWRGGEVEGGLGPEVVFPQNLLEDGEVGGSGRKAFLGGALLGGISWEAFCTRTYISLSMDRNFFSRNYFLDRNFISRN